jgi:type II secretory pathway component PulC
MLREIVHTLRSKLPRSLPSLVSTALAVLLVVDAWLLACQLLLAHGSMQKLDALEAGTPDPSAITPRKDIDVDALVAANLFGAPEPPPVNTDPNAVPLSASNLILTGTLALRNPKKGMTIVSNDGKSAIYKVGATLAGAVVLSIYKDRVILDRGGTVEALVMPHAKPPGGVVRGPGARQCWERSGGHARRWACHE